MDTRLLKQDRIDIAVMWEVCVHFLWDDTLVVGIDQLLKKHSAKNVIDCAGGIGFPSIGLRKKGWSITYSDGSSVMYEVFKGHLANEGVTMPHCLLEWKHLTRRFLNQFDALLCRGNSLGYVDSWNKPLRSNEFINIRKALDQFFQIIKPGGIIYIDTAQQEEFDLPHYPIIHEFGEKQLGGHVVKLAWLVSYNKESKTKTWSCDLVIDGQPHHFSYQSYLLAPTELTILLREAGFQNVQEIIVPGENWYTTFLGIKPK